MTSPPTRKQGVWRKRAIRAILCLLLGAVMTVGVAWYAAYTWSPDGGEGEDLAAAWLWPMPASADWPPARRGRRSIRLLTTERSVYGRPDHDGPWIGRHWIQWTLQCGWPARSMSLGCAYKTGFQRHLPPWMFAGSSPDNSFGFALPIPEAVRSRRQGGPRNQFLPTHPLLPGFLLNTLFYAAPWWLIFITLGRGGGAIRRFRRRRRGRCIDCGYDLAGLRTDDNTTPTCPECGA